MSNHSNEVLTSQQKKWLNHLRACRAEKRTLKAYATEHGLAVQSLYQAASDLRRLGVWGRDSPTRPRRSKVSGESRGVFVQAELRPEEVRPSPWRARLRNGVVIEGSSGLTPELLRALSGL